MRHCLRHTLFAWLCCTALHSFAADRLPANVRAALAQAGVPPEALAAVALPLGPGAFVRPWRWRDTQPMAPASTMKLVTSVVALAQLGPNHRGFTALRTAAPVLNGVLHGDLVLQGGADPDLGVAQFWQMLLDLREQGITHIDGDLVVDRNLWRPARPDVGLPPFDEAPEFPYNVIPDALQLAGNLLTLDLHSDGTSVRAKTWPALSGIHLSSRMALTDTACKDWDADWQSARVSSEAAQTLIELQGGFPRQCSQRAELQLIDRQQLTEALFKTLWTGLGGLWTGRAREAEAPTNANTTRLLVQRTSRTWGEVLRPMNKTSDNAHTRMLFMALGVPAMASEPTARTADLAGRAVRRWMSENGIDSTGLVLDNGSGLSRSERISPRQLAQILKVAHSSRFAPDFMMSLPVAGVDGTMRNRLKSSGAAGWARLKTGTLRDTTALAGYVIDPKGRPWAVAMMINHDFAANARPALDLLVDGIARAGPHGAPALRPGPQAEGP